MVALEYVGIWHSYTRTYISDMPIADAKITKRSVICSTQDIDSEDSNIRLSRSWLRIAIAMVFAGQGMVFSLAINMTPPEYGSTSYWFLHGGLILSSLLVVCFLGSPLLRSTIGMVCSRRLSIEGLFAVSLLGAFAGSLLSTFTGQGAVYYEIVSIVIAIYTIGRLLSSVAQDRLGRETIQIRECFDSASMCTENGWITVKVKDVPTGAIVRVHPGEPISVDGTIYSGSAYVSETALTGEALPVVRNIGDSVRAGTWSVDGLLEIKVRAQAGNRDLDDLLQRVDNQAVNPSKFEAQANRLIQYFLPFVVITSFLCFTYWLFAGSWVEAVFNSMAVLLVACPCALGLATPIAIWQGLLRLAKMGIVSRDGALIDALATTRLVYFDKTGTLSDATMQVTNLHVVKEWEDRHESLRAMIYALESKLSHPIARAITNFLPKSDLLIKNFKIIPGLGVSGTIANKYIEVGELRLNPNLVKDDILAKIEVGKGKSIYVFIDKQLAAIFTLKEQLRYGFSRLIRGFKNLNIELEVLTGDPNPEIELPVFVRSGLSAQQKESHIRSAIKNGLCPIFVGDGINDAPAMTACMASISMGSGTALTRSIASAQLVNDQISVLPEAIHFTRALHRRLRSNLIYAASYNVLGMSLAFFGILHPIVAAIIMGLSSFIVTIRAACFNWNYNPD